tara:strand:+ start:2457 stop:3479 length:1023 start_codon:yes stop_codon:yes gene_type:complete
MVDYIIPNVPLVSFDDVLLTPQFSEIVSRSDVNTSRKLRAVPEFRIPIISAPMDTVTESTMAEAMNRAGGLGIIHRYNSISEQTNLAENNLGVVGAAIGATGDFVERAGALIDAGVNVLCIDIAHGHHVLMRHALTVLRKTFGDNIHIMAGNVATRQAFDDLADWGADSIKVGIGGGSICSTRIQTGHGMPTLASVIDCSKSDRDVALIADGGIKNPGDIVKALAAGADFVMLGSMLSGTKESPGNVIQGSDGKSYKSYRGMASKEAQYDWRGHTASLEGVSSRVPYKGSVSNILSEVMVNVRSGMSYSGASDIAELQKKASFTRQSSSGFRESKPHILL